VHCPRSLCCKVELLFGAGLMQNCLKVWKCFKFQRALSKSGKLGPAYLSVEKEWNKKKIRTLFQLASNRNCSKKIFLVKGKSNKHCCWKTMTIAAHFHASVSDDQMLLLK